MRRLMPRGRLGLILHYDSEQPLLVETSQVGMEGLCLAYQGVTGDALRERPEGFVGIDIVDDHRAAGPKDGPYAAELEAHIALTMQAVMDEEIDLAELREQSRKLSPARAGDVGPAIRQAAVDRDADLRPQGRLERRKIDAPEPPDAVHA